MPNILNNVSGIAGKVVNPITLTVGAAVAAGLNSGKAVLDNAAAEDIADFMADKKVFVDVRDLGYKAGEIPEITMEFLEKLKTKVNNIDDFNAQFHDKFGLIELTPKAEVYHALYPAKTGLAATKELVSASRYTIPHNLALAAFPLAGMAGGKKLYDLYKEKTGKNDTVKAACGILKEEIEKRAADNTLQNIIDMSDMDIEALLNKHTKIKGGE